MKKKLYIIGIILFILFLIIGFIVHKPSKSKEKITINEDGELEEEIFEFDNFDYSGLEDKDVTIKDVLVYIVNDSLKIETTLENNTRKEIDGFYVHLEFLDANDKVLFTSAKASDEKIPARGTITIDTFVSLNKENQKISSARIHALDKNTKDTIDYAK